MTRVELIEKRENGIEIYSLSSEKLEVRVANLGAHILAIMAEDRSGTREDVVLSWDNIEDCGADGTYMGATVGRVANRIGGAAFELNGKKYTLAANNGNNHLHGGKLGFNQKIFDVQNIENGISMTYLSPDGEEGYPGNLTLTVEYVVEEDTLTINYHAISDQDTLCNITNHSYFNLSGCGDSICNHKLMVAADRFGCVDETCLATGKLMEVKGTPFDFTEYHYIGDRIEECHEQLKNGGGYDHSFILNKDSEQIKLQDEKSGRELIITTSYPVVQVYTGNFLEGGKPGKGGVEYRNREGVALEVHRLPNSINTQDEPDMILRAGEEYRAATKYRFTVKK